MGMKELFTSLSLPDCAVKVNGTYLEEIVVGYRTNSVKGREPMDVSITEVTVGNNNGSRYQRKRDETRTLTLSFVLLADTMPEYHVLMNKLKSVLHGEEQQFIFKDEPDVYYTGTVESIDADPLFTMEADGCSGTISIHCADPYKYSVKEKTVSATLDNGCTFDIDYKGTHPAKPVIEVTMNGDNGYIGLLDQKGHILEFGNIEEVDKTYVNKTEQLATFDDLLYTKDDVNGYDAMHPYYGTAGSLTTGVWYNTTFLKFGSAGAKKGNANGGLRTFTFPADSSGAKGAKNWYSYWHLLFYAGLLGQTGEMSISFLTSDNKLIAGCNWFKTDMVGNTGYYEFVTYSPTYPDPSDPRYVKILNRFSYTTSHWQDQNPWFWDWGHCDLRKEGSKLTFYYNGKYYSYTIPQVENMLCTKVQIAIKQWGDRTPASGTFLTYAGFDKFYFNKLNVTYWIESNVFSKNDKLVVDIPNCKVKLNGLTKNAIGKIANMWDDFELQPGSNQIKVTYSTWAKKPTLKLKYREAYL